jgi:hypothetical protein
MNMAFALCPDNGLPRLWRFVDQSLGWGAGGLPVVAILHREENILKIDRVALGQLGEMEQHMALRTHSRFVYANGRIGIHLND